MSAGRRFKWARRDFFRSLALAFIAPLARATEPEKPAPMQKKFKLRADQIRDLVPAMGGALASDRITVDGARVGYMYRDVSDSEDDSGWTFLAGNETQAYLDVAANAGIYAVNTIANYDPEIIPFIETPAPCAFERVAGPSHFRSVKR